MARPKSDRPTDGELEILTIMWQRSSDCTVRDVHDVMSGKRTISQTTIDKRMRVMVEKKLLQIVDERRPTRFRAIDQSRTHDSLLKDLIQRIGSPTNMVMHLLRAGRISKHERQQVQDQLDQME